MDWLDPRSFEEHCTSQVIIAMLDDAVTHPPHYLVGGIPTYNFILAKKLNYPCGQVVKYVVRAQHKGAELEDLRKAQWYLTREIERLAEDE